MLKSGFISSAQIWPGSDMKIWLDSVLGGRGALSITKPMGMQASII